MNASHPDERLRFLLETVVLEAEHLQGTDQRLFEQPFTAERARTLRQDTLLAERLDAFTARFGRLQDTLGDKLLPALLARVGEPVGSVLDNLDRAHRLELLAVPAEDWLAARALRNRMVHEYIRQAELLADAVTAAHEAIPMLLDFAHQCQDYAAARQLVGPRPAFRRQGRPT
jgi:hypothetical protein